MKKLPKRLKATDIIKGNLGIEGDITGPHCVAGWCREVWGKSWWFKTMKFADFLRDKGYTRIEMASDAINWNDRKSTSKTLIAKYLNEFLKENNAFK